MPGVDVPEGPGGSRQYPHAPIIEAVLEMRVDLADGVTVDDLQAACASPAEYSVQQPYAEWTGSFNVAPTGVSTNTSQDIKGHDWRTPDGLRRVRAKLDMYLYMQRAPYTNWDDFVHEAERHWLLYKEVARPVRLARIGARFVNRIDVPHTSIELSEYVTVSAPVPPGLPQVISGYLVTMNVPEVRPGVDCTVISTLVPPESQGTTSIVVDIDVWASPVVRPDSDSFDAAVRDVLTELRRAKNSVFEACITDNARRLFL